MAKIVSIHSFRGGTGKSNTTANLAALLAMQGRRVGIVDTDIQSPGIHVLFGKKDGDFKYVLNDFLWGRCEKMAQAACDVSGVLPPDATGRVFLIPSSVNAADIARIINDGYDMDLLSSGFRALVKDLALDFLLIDTHPGLNEETLLSIALSNVLIVVLRPDYQDYEGTGITVEVGRELGVPEILLVVNKSPPSISASEVRTRMEEAYHLPIGALIPHCDDLMNLASRELFVCRHPQHAVTDEYRKLLTAIS